MPHARHDLPAHALTGHAPRVSGSVPTRRFVFSGDHALGGELHGRDEIGAWFARLRRLFPNLKLTPMHIVVNGGPWATTVAPRFRAKATLPDGEQYANEGMQYLRLHWTAIVEDRLYEDTVQLCAALQSIANAGQPEALAAPLGSHQDVDRATPHGSAVR